MKKTDSPSLSYCEMDFTKIISPDDENGFAVIKLVKVPAVFMIEAGDSGSFYIYFVGVDNITFNRHDGVQDCLGELPEIPFSISTIHAGEEFETRHCQDVKVYRFSDYLMLESAPFAFRSLLMPKPVPHNFMGLKNKSGWVSGVSGSFQHAGLDVCLSFDPPVKVEETIKQPFKKEEPCLMQDSATSHSDSVQPDGESTKSMQGPVTTKKKKNISSRERRKRREQKAREEEETRRLKDTATASVKEKVKEIPVTKVEEHREEEPVVMLNKTPASKLGVSGAPDITHDTGGPWVEVGKGGKPKKEKRTKQKTFTAPDLPRGPKQPPQSSAVPPVTSMAGGRGLKYQGDSKKRPVMTPSSATVTVLQRKSERVEDHRRQATSYIPPRGRGRGSRDYRPTPPSKGGNQGYGIGVVSQNYFDSLRGVYSSQRASSSEPWGPGEGGTDRMKRRM
ncbi:hypothetical protein ACWJJH_12965 [Endozoicomonadaceae bacterium StTr2]